MAKGPASDETLHPGESLLRVGSSADVRPGDMIRIWHGQLNQWIPGWWCEVLKVEGTDVVLKDLQSGEEKRRTLPPDTWKHPNSGRVRAIGDTQGQAEGGRLAALRREYEGLDFATTPEAEMLATLQRELEWKQSNSGREYHIAEDFEIHDIAIIRIGEDLFKRGGLDLMKRVMQTDRTASLKYTWNGIGGWYA